MPRTRFGLEGYGVRRAGTFSGKTPGGGGGGGGSHPVGLLTRLGLDGYGVRRAGSFGGKTPGGGGGGGGGSHPVLKITRLSADGYGARRCGSFAGKTHGVSTASGFISLFAFWLGGGAQAAPAPLPGASSPGRITMSDVAVTRITLGDE